MTASNKPNYTEAYAWIWLPNETEPVVAGVLTRDEKNLFFNYGSSYLARNNAISIYDKELPLQRGELPLLNNLTMPSCIRDASPDAWGRRVIINKIIGATHNKIDTDELDELTYLLESGSDRIGALDFQCSATQYVPRLSSGSLEELLDSAARVEAGAPLSTDLAKALQDGSAIGGARPKALIENNHKKWVAKFSSSSDLHSVVKAEFIAMRLASMVNINVAPVKLVKALGKDVLLIERFDREKTPTGWTRKLMISALTLLGLSEMEPHYASYADLAEIIRARFDDPTNTLKELFARLVFNILCGNTDDHARNHAAFWDGKILQLTPAYDICPCPRTGSEASQAMIISGTQRLSQLVNCIEASHHFLLSKNEARNIIEHQKQTVVQQWDTICDEAELNKVDKSLFWHRQFLNSYAFENM